MILIPRYSMSDDVVEEIRTVHNDFKIGDLNYQGRSCLVYAKVDLTDKEYTLFLLRWGEYFEV